MIILRIHPEHIPKVFELSMHALARSPTLLAGDQILISLAIAKIKDGLPPIRYIMEFVRIRPDFTGDASRKIWGKKWPYILHGQNCRQLASAFDIRNHQVSDHNYGQGGPFVYVDPRDEAVIKVGMLSGFDSVYWNDWCVDAAHPAVVASKDD